MRSWDESLCADDAELLLSAFNAWAVAGRLARQHKAASLGNRKSLRVRAMSLGL